MDGVNVTDSGYGSVNSYNIVYGTLGAGVTTDILDEVQVKTAGFDAEYGQALGGIVTGVIKSGTNHLSGNGACVGDRIQRRRGRVVREGGDQHRLGGVARRQPGADRGRAAGQGPPVRLRALQASTHHAKGHDPAGHEPDLELDTGATATYPNANPYPASLTPGREIERTRYNYAAKLTWNASARQRVEFVAFGDPSTGDGRNGLRYGDIIMTGLADTDGDGTGDAEVTKQAASFGDGGLVGTSSTGRSDTRPATTACSRTTRFSRPRSPTVGTRRGGVDGRRLPLPGLSGHPGVVLRRGDALRGRHLRGGPG